LQQQQQQQLISMLRGAAGHSLRAAVISRIFSAFIHEISLRQKHCRIKQA